MTEESRTTELANASLVLHVIPTPTARGAQREARALADRLDAPGTRHHRVLVLFDGPPDVAVDATLGCGGGNTPGTGFDPRVVARLRSALCRMDPELVVAHGSEPLKYLVPAMFGRRRPLAYYTIGTYSGARGAPQTRLWKYLIGRADVIIAEGEEVRSECIDRLGVDPDRVVSVPNGRDDSLFHPRTGRSEPVPVLIFVGALTTGKRPEQFIRVVSELRQRGVPFTAKLVGDGPLREELAGPAEAAGVEMLGSRGDIPVQLRGADVFLFPSRPAGEGMPGVLVEAAMTGLPVVATAVPGVASIVVNGETGIVVPVDDHPAMIDATVKLLADGKVRASMGRAARRHALEHFTLTAVAERWMSVLQPLLDSRPDGLRVGASTR